MKCRYLLALEKLERYVKTEINKRRRMTPIRDAVHEKIVRDQQEILTKILFKIKDYQIKN